MAELTILYDGACPLCQREVSFLERRDQTRHPEGGKLAFVDIDRVSYDPRAHQGITYREAMGRIHAIDGSGTVLRDLAVFHRAYALIGLGWLYAPIAWPLVGPLMTVAYRLWARMRLMLTRRPNLEQLCREREGVCAGDGACRLTAEG